MSALRMALLACALGALPGALPLGGATARAALPSPPDVQVREDDGSIEIGTPAAAVTVDKATFRLRFLDRTGGGSRLMTEEPEGGGVSWDRRDGSTGRPGAVRGRQPVKNGVRLSVDTSEGRRASITVRFLSRRTALVLVEPPDPASLAGIGERFASPSDESIYGLSERPRDSREIAPGVIEIPIEDANPVPGIASLDRRGEIVEMKVRPTIALYAPFYQSSRGYGVAALGTTIGSFDVARTDPAALSFRFETGRSGASRVLAYLLIAGPRHATILDEYTAVTGRPFAPPDWAFLPWRYRDELPAGGTSLLDGVPVNATVAEDVNMLEWLDIPLGVYLFDRPWAVDTTDAGFGYSRFLWDADRFPNTRSMVSSLRRRGVRILVWGSTFACGSAPGDNGRTAERSGYLAPGSEGSPLCGNAGDGDFILDVTNPAARAFLRDRAARFFAGWQIDGVKLDRGEEFIPSGTDDVWFDGRNGREVRNAYPVLQAELFHDALARARGDDFLVIARAAYTGAQRHAIFWGGDAPGSTSFGGGPGTDLGLRDSILGQLRAAFLGYPIWGSDIGGYYEFKDRDVFARWIEFGAFSGIMNVGGKGTHAPWDMPTEPAWDEEMIGIYRKYSKLRVRLQPYLVAAAREAARTGMPIARPLVFLDPSDPNLRNVWDEYLFGPDLLVAPVWRTGQRERQVYLPRGSWRSYWDPTERHEGPVTVTVPVPLDSIPVYVRGDAIAP